MSRIGNRKLTIPAGVTVTVDNNVITVKGPKGELSQEIGEQITAKIEENEVRVEEVMVDDADIVIVAYGITSRICKSAMEMAREKGIKVGLVRPITLWPFPVAPYRKAADKVKEIISVELSMGQMIEDVKLATECKKPVTLCNRVGGMIVTPQQVLEEIKKANGGAL